MLKLKPVLLISQRSCLRWSPVCFKGQTRTQEGYVEFKDQTALNNTKSLCSYFTRTALCDRPDHVWEQEGQIARVTTRLYPCYLNPGYLPPSSSITTPILVSVTHLINIGSLLLLIHVCVYTQLLSPDCGLLPGIKNPEKDTWSPAPGSPPPSPRCAEHWEIKG